MPGDHALLSPSGAKRWITCTPSARLEENFEDEAGIPAEEGTLAHKLVESILQYKTRLIDKPEYERLLAEIKADKLYANAMFEYCDQFAAVVLEKFAEAQMRSPDALLFLEQRYDLSRWVPAGFGTGDISILADRLLEIVDYKYGKGVVVDADDNEQMKLYALGALEKFGHLYDIETVRMSIYQPRVDNFPVFEMSVADLLQWAESELKPKAVLAFAGEGDFVPGDHCGFCRARAVCKANAEYNLEIAKHQFEVPVFLDEFDIADILERAPQFTKWIKAVEEYALKQAVNHGIKWPGFKLVEGRSNRVFIDPNAVAAELMIAGYPFEAIHKPTELLGITALEDTFGKKKLGEVISDLIVKPAGQLTLVPVSDKREEYNSLDAARRDFDGHGEDDAEFLQ